MNFKYRVGGARSQVKNGGLTNSKRLCAPLDIPDGGALEIVTEIDAVPESLILLRRGDEVSAFLNVCPHAGRRLDWAPGRFLIDAGLLVCAAHGACFSIPDGVCVSGPCRGQTLTRVAIDGDTTRVSLVGAAAEG